MNTCAITTIIVSDQPLLILILLTRIEKRKVTKDYRLFVVLYTEYRANLCGKSTGN